MLPDPIEKPLLTVDDLAELGIVPGKKRSALHEAVRAGDIPSVRISGRVYIPTAVLRRAWGIDPPLTANEAPVATEALAASPDPAATKQEDHRERTAHLRPIA